MVWLVTMVTKSVFCVASGSSPLSSRVADFQKVAAHRQLLDRVAAIQELALSPVDVGVDEVQAAVDMKPGS
jgi:hypothetical protein